MHERPSELKTRLGLFLRLSLLGLIVTVSSLPAAGVEATSETEVEDGNAEADAPEAKPGYHTDNFRIRPSVTVTEVYDDNIFATDVDTRSDWITRITPQIKFDSTWTKHSLKFKVGAESGRYWQFDAENYLDYWASAEGRYNLTDAMDLFGGLGIAFEHEGRDSPDVVVAGLTPTTYRTTNAHAGIKTTLGDITYRVGATFERLNFDNIQSGSGLLINDYRDRDLIGFGARMTNRIDPDTSVFIQALYDGREYHTPVDLTGFDRDSHGYRAAVGAVTKFGGGNKAEFFAGILGQRYDDSRFDAVRRPDFGGQLTLVPNDTLRITADLQRALNETTLAGSPGYLTTALSGKLELRPTPRLIPYLSLAYSESDYLQSEREDSYYSAELGAKYFLTRNSYLIAGARHAVLDSNDAGLSSGSNDYDKNVFFLTFGTQGYPLFEPLISSYRTDAQVTAGVLSVANDALRFGRYNGLGDEGLQWNADLTVHSTDGQQGYAEFLGTDLGLDDRSLSIDWGVQGTFDANIRYSQIPYRDFSGKTVFRDVGSDYLTLPGGWVAADQTQDLSQLSDSLQDVEIGSMRKRLGIGSTLYNIDKHWTVRLDYDTETKQGLTQLAGLIGTSAGDGRSVLLPAPVDYTTNTLKAALGYTGKRTQLRFSYDASFFYNNLTSLTWESPFTNTGPRGTEGRLALPPDNQFHQLSFSVGHALTQKTRFTGVASVGLMLQDEAFLPDTVDSALTPHFLPRVSLEGEVYLYNANLALISRPLRGLNLKASYRIQKRDNRTPQDTYTYYVNDSFAVGTSSPDTATNQPYSYDKRTLKLDAGYRLHRKARVSGDISRQTIERSPSEVSKTTEDKGSVKLRLSPLDNVQVSLTAGAASRTGSDYQTIAGENPLLRKYNISDRERTSYGIDFSYQPTERLSLSLNLSLNEDDYDETRIGLLDAKQTAATLDASYAVSPALSIYGFLGREKYQSRQAGSQDVPSDVPPGSFYADWFVHNDDTVDSVGLGVRWKKNSRLALGADYSLSRSTGRIDIASSNASPPVTPFPDLKTRSHSLRLYADYQLQKNTKLRFDYRYERYDADDWSVDGVNADTIPEVLLLNEDNGSYKQHVIGVGLSIRF